MSIRQEMFAARADSLLLDGPWLFWDQDRVDGNLLESLREHGQLAPVLVAEDPDGLRLVAGASRVRCLAALGEPVLARLLEGAGKGADTPVSRGLLYLEDNGRRPLDGPLRLAALRFFTKYMDGAALAPHALATEILPRLGLGPKSGEARDLLAWLALETHWDEHLKAGRAPLALGPVLAGLEPGGRAALEPFFVGLGWSRSLAVGFVTDLMEAARREGPGGASLELSGLDMWPELLRVLDADLSPKDATARLRSLARRARMPELTRLEGRFQELAQGLAGKSGHKGMAWKLTPEQHFETGGVELFARVRSRADLERAVDSLRAMADAPEWEGLFGLGDVDD